MKRTMITWMLAGTLLATTAAACGSDEEKDEKPASTEAVSDDGGDSGESSGNAEVDEYCQAAEDLAAELKKVMADPTSGDVAALTAQAQELATQAATLGAAVAGDAAAAQKVQECSTALANSLAGG
jgi:hypothetical protein